MTGYGCGFNGESTTQMTPITRITRIKVKDYDQWVQLMLTHDNLGSHIPPVTLFLINQINPSDYSLYSAKHAPSTRQAHHRFLSINLTPPTPL